MNPIIPSGTVALSGPAARTIPGLDGMHLRRADNPDFRGAARYGDRVHVVDAAGAALTPDAAPTLAEAGPRTAWTLEDPADPAGKGPVPRFGAIRLRSPHGTYLGARPDGTLEAVRETPGPWETWDLALPAGATVAIQCGDNGRFLRVADPDEGRRVEAAGTSPTDPRCQFVLMRTRDDQGRPWIGLRSLHDDLNVQMTPGFVLRTENRNFQAPSHTWEHFRVEGDRVFSRVVGGYLNHVPDARRRSEDVRGHATGRPDAPCAGDEPSARFTIVPLPAAASHARVAEEAVEAWRKSLGVDAPVPATPTVPGPAPGPVREVLGPVAGVPTPGLETTPTPETPAPGLLPEMPEKPEEPAMPPAEVVPIDLGDDVAKLIDRRPKQQGNATEVMDGRRIGLVMAYVHDPVGGTRAGIPVRLLADDKLADTVRTDQRGIALLRYPRRLSNEEGFVGVVEVRSGDEDQHRQAMFHIPAGRQHTVVELVLDELPETDGLGDDPLRRLPIDFGLDVYDDVVRLLGHGDDPLLGGRDDSNRFASRRAPTIKRSKIVRNGPDAHNRHRQYVVNLRQEWVFLGYSLGEVTSMESLSPGALLDETERSLEQTLEELQEAFSKSRDVAEGLVERAARQVQNLASRVQNDATATTATDTDVRSESQVNQKATSVGLNLGFLNVNHVDSETKAKARVRASLRSKLRTSALETATSSATLANNSQLRESQQRVNEVMQRASNLQRNLQTTKSRVFRQISPLLSRATNLLNWQIYENYVVATRVEDVVEVTRTPVFRVEGDRALFSAEDIVEYAPILARELKRGELMPNFDSLADLVEEYRRATSPVRVLRFDVQFAAPDCGAVLRVRVGVEETSIRLRRGQTRASGYIRLDRPMTSMQLARTPAQLTLVAASDFDRPAPITRSRQVEHTFFGNIRVPYMEQYLEYPDPSYRTELHQLTVEFTTTKGVPLSTQESFGTDFVITHGRRRTEERMDLSVPAPPSLPEDDPLYLHVNRNPQHYMGLLMEAALDDPNLRRDVPQLRRLGNERMWKLPLLGFEAGEAMLLADVDDADALGKSLLGDEGAATIVQIAAPGSYGEALQGILQLDDLKGRVPPQLLAQIQAVPAGSRIVDPQDPMGAANPSGPESEPNGSTPSLPSTPGVPEVPATPGVPSAPSLPNVPGVPDLPNVPL